MANNEYVETLLLIALPASGKSEVRRYLMHVDRDRRIEEFHLSDTVQLDDYPYVEFFRDADEALDALGQPAAFFHGPQGRFRHAEDWGTLLQLVNDDWEVMTNPSLPTPTPDPQWLFDRIDRARARVGAPAPFAGLSRELRASLSDKLQRKTRWVVDELFGRRPASMEGKTLVIEFARGGPEGADFPLDPPHGYAWCLSNLRKEILERAGVLYIWVTPEESRRKNAARAVPPPGSDDTVLFHAAPEEVMREDYGCDDIDWLMSVAEHPNTIPIRAHGTTWHLPISRFDNRDDKTTQLREDPATWDPDTIEELHGALAKGLHGMWSAHQALRGPYGPAGGVGSGGSAPKRHSA